MTAFLTLSRGAARPRLVRQGSSVLLKASDHCHTRMCSKPCSRSRSVHALPFVHLRTSTSQSNDNLGGRVDSLVTKVIRILPFAASAHATLCPASLRCAMSCSWEPRARDLFLALHRLEVEVEGSCLPYLTPYKFQNPTQATIRV